MSINLNIILGKNSLNEGYLEEQELMRSDTCLGWPNHGGGSSLIMVEEDAVV